ncbi:MAG: hypothetical protein MK213_05760 [Planctomycetes bacterium]|nr:hypothetical protein [Planctomycetota bacterium]
MKQSLLISCGLMGILAVAPAVAQDDLVAKYEKKIAKSWVAHGSWSEDFEGSLTRAKAENKVIFAYFTRSYAP